MKLGPLLLLTAAVLGAQSPAFFSWHSFEYEAYRSADRDLTAQLHFRTRNRFSTFNLLRGSVFGSQRLPRGWNLSGGFLIQDQEGAHDYDDWLPQQRVFAAISRPIRQRKLRHTPRFQYDYLYAMPTAAYGRYRFAWQTEWAARVRPYAAVEEFIENAGIQRFRPRAGVRFRAGSYLETDFAYIYDRIYLRGSTNRHILQTTFSFHRPRRD